MAQYSYWRHINRSLLAFNVRYKSLDITNFLFKYCCTTAKKEKKKTIYFYSD